VVFNSYSFLVFFAVNVALFLLPLPWTIKKINLLVASYLFYAAWNPPFVLLLMLSAVVDYWLARWIGASENEGFRKCLLLGSLIMNLGLQALFKYGRFIVENFNGVLGFCGVEEQAPLPDLILPLGISFYTFETVSYLIDVYRRRLQPSRSFLDYALFLTFFPHLVAGPIVRAEDFLPQCAIPRRPTWSQFGWGASLMLLGMFQKIILADLVLAGAADRVYVVNAPVATSDAWFGTLAFAGQIFFDFAGYSTCGIGAALCLGFALKTNFKFPYGAIGFSDFWRRWHISLSSWLRDYLYIPMGGSRGAQAAVCRNLMATMLLGGLWHGADWKFVAWGGLHGGYLLGERGLRHYFGHWKILEWPLVRGLLILATFVLVLFTWVYFRADNFASANRILASMFGWTTATESVLGSARKIGIGAVLLGLVLVHTLMRDKSLEDVAAKIPWYAVAGFGAILAMIIILFPGEERAFIYFQF